MMMAWKSLVCLEFENIGYPIKTMYVRIVVLLRIMSKAHIIQLLQLSTRTLYYSPTLWYEHHHHIIKVFLFLGRSREMMPFHASTNFHINVMGTLPKLAVMRCLLPSTSAVCFFLGFLFFFFSFLVRARKMSYCCVYQFLCILYSFKSTLILLLLPYLLMYV